MEIKNVLASFFLSTLFTATFTLQHPRHPRALPMKALLFELTDLFISFLVVTSTRLFRESRAQL